MDSDFVVGINKSIDAAKGETGQTYPAYLHNTLVTKKLDELAEAITEGGGGASALSDLEDVDISGTVQGGKVLKYNAVEEKWAPGDDSGNVQSDWDENDPTSGAFILNKPPIPDAQVQANWNESDTTSKAYIQNKPTIPDAQVQSNWNENDTTSKAYIQNKPIIPDELSDLSDDATHRTVTDAEKTAWDGKATMKQMSVTDYEALPESEKMSEKVVYALPNADFYIPTIYGMRIKDNESVSAQKITYLNDASNMEPAYMDFANNKFEYGSWANAFFMPRPCMLKYDGTVDYYLDPNDYYKKEDGTTSDVDDYSYDGNAMIEWGQNGVRIWYKVVPDELDPKSCEVYVSNYKVNNTYKAWSFINNDGDLVDHFYTPIFNGTIDGSGKLRSISDKTYTDYCKNKTAAQEIAAAQLNNPTGEDLWYTEVYCDVNLINYLLLLMSKNTDTQAAYGYGRSTVIGSAEYMLDTGTMNTKGMFWGSNDGTSGVKVFGMENYWANQHRRLAGLLTNNGVYYYKFTKGTEDGSTASDYSTTSSTGYLVGPTAGATSGYAKSMSYKSDGFYGCIDVSGGSGTTYYADYYYINTSGLRYAYRGGRCSNAWACGASYFYLYYATGSAYWDIGAALSCKPKKIIPV